MKKSWMPVVPRSMVLACLCGTLVGGMTGTAWGQAGSGQDESAGQAIARSDDAAKQARAKELIAKATAYLQSKQDASTGGWKTEGTGPKFPAITGLVLTGMLLDPAADPKDAAIAQGVKYLLGTQKPDGGIYDSNLPSYNTSISVCALTKVKTQESAEAVKRAVEFLKSLQCGEAAVGASQGHQEAGVVVGKEHPFYGGVGYGRHGRPDLSNLGWMLEALHEAGVEGSDESFKRALVFLERTQMLDKTADGTPVNTMEYAQGSKQGGFIYSTSINKEKVGVGQSMPSDMIEETLDDGTKVSRLRCYGSMTYTGFKSYLYADLKRDDPRVQAAMGWMRDNYTLDENPGLGKEGLYYYYVVMARALAAWGEPELPVMVTRTWPDGEKTMAERVVQPVNWADDLVSQLAEMQQDDGSFKSVHERWMENDPILITAYALIALRYAEKYESGQGG